MSKRTKWLLGIGVIAALVIGWQVAAFAVHDDGVFQLDGNAASATHPANITGDDWDTLGMRGTQSRTTRLNGAVARAEHVVRRIDPGSL